MSSSAGTGKTTQIFNILKQIPEDLPMILFLEYYELEKYIRALSKEQRERVIFKNYKKNENYKNITRNLLKKNHILIYIFEYSSNKIYETQSQILEIIKEINLQKKEKLIKIFLMIDYLRDSFFNKFEYYLNKNNSNNLSYFYLEQEGFYNDLFDINIIFKSKNNLKNMKIIKKCKKIVMSIRDLLCIPAGHFYILKNEELNPTLYFLEKMPIITNEEINLEDYKYKEIKERIENF